MIVIDGSHGEGGGQILRTSLSLSALSSTPVRITGIRRNRPNPGLSHQHVAAVGSAAKICGAELEGCSKGSSVLVFRPSGIMGGDYKFDIGTAGSAVLVLQTILPMLLRTESTVEITGGTDVKWSPSVDYFRHVFLSFLERMGARVECTLLERGHYPRGGGRIRLRTEPSQITPGTLTPLTTRGEFQGIRGQVHVSRLPESIGERIARSARGRLQELLKGDLPCEDGDMEIQCSSEEGSTGCGITLWGKFRKTVMGYGLCGERGLSSEKLGRRAATTLVREMLSPATVDEWCSDQLIPYLACRGLFSGGGLGDGDKVDRSGEPPSLVREVSSHLRTNIWVLRHFGFTPGEEGLVEQGSR